MLPIVLLIVHTLIFWYFALLLHQKKTKLTLIPLYGLTGAFTVFTHTLSSFGSSVMVGNYVFLIASTTYFTTLLLAVIILYLIDGPRAARKVLEVIVGISIIQALTVFLVGLEDTKTTWIPISTNVFRDYFWSVLTMIIDIILVGVVWELLSKLKVKNLFISVFLVLLIVFFVDTFIYTTAVFGNNQYFWSIIQSNLIIRFVLAIIMGALISSYLKYINFSEEKRKKPEHILEIIDFASVGEREITKMKSGVEELTEIEKKLEESQEAYKLILEGIDVGVWKVNQPENKMEWSNRLYELLEYNREELSSTVENWIELFYETDKIRMKNLLESFNDDNTYKTAEVRLRTKSGTYKWFQCSWIIKEYDGTRLIVGAIKDIQRIKDIEKSLETKVAELTKINDLLIDREIKMGELKKQRQLEQEEGL